MKKIIGLLLFTSICVFCFARGKADNEIPSESEVYAFQGDENQEDSETLTLKYTLRQPEGQPIQLKESWGYVMQSRLDEYDNSIPLTDVCFFAAEVNCYGELSSVPNRSRIKVGNARCHLVVICESRSLTHFILDPNFYIRKQLLKEIVKAAGPYDVYRLILSWFQPATAKTLLRSLQI